MFDERDLDHRLDGWRSGLEGKQSGMSIGCKKHDKAARDAAVREAVKDLKSNLKSVWEFFDFTIYVTKKAG